MKKTNCKELKNLYTELYKETWKHRPDYEVIDELHHKIMKLINRIDYEIRTIQTQKHN